MFESIPIFDVCGYSGSGKTTLLEQVVPRLLRRGLRVAVVKHDVHGIAPDGNRKDGDRLFQAGADVVVHGPGESLGRYRCREDFTPRDQLEQLAELYDLVLLEGFKQLPCRKVWLLRNGESALPDGIGPCDAVMPWDSERATTLDAILTRFLDEVAGRSRVFGCVLIGGGSKRMGRPKHLLPCAKDVTVHRGLSQFSRREGRCLGKSLDRRENGTVPLAPREGDRSMFSANRLPAKCVFRPKNGPVPSQPVNAYAKDLQETWLHRTVRVLRRTCEQVVVAGGGALPEDLRGLTTIPDPPDFGGPMAGLLAAMRWAPRAGWLLAACDLPCLSEKAVRWILAQRGPGVWAVLPQVADSPRVEPLLAWYDFRCRPVLESMAISDRHALREISRHPKARVVAVPAALADAWTDADTPQAAEPFL